MPKCTEDRASATHTICRREKSEKRINDMSFWEGGNPAKGFSAKRF
jgi:hypothetical protein